MNSEITRVNKILASATRQEILELISQHGETLRTTSIKVFNKHKIKCPYCGEKAWYKVNL